MMVARPRSDDRAAGAPAPHRRPPARNEAYAEALERRLRETIVEGYAARSADAWSRDYSDERNFLASVGPNRERWRALLAPPPLEPSGPVRRRTVTLPGGLRSQWVSVPLGNGLATEGLLALPDRAGAPVPLVIAQHGIECAPESVFEEGTAGVRYRRFGLELLERGFAVLAPMNLATMERRNRIQRMARLLGTTLEGIELSRLRRLLDAVLAGPGIDTARVAMWGLSWGGMASLYFAPLEPRIGVVVVAGFFNERLTKMSTPDPRYSCFLDTPAEHAFLHMQLTEFADADLVSLICPRPLLVQHGKLDPIAWWPAVEDEFARARSHYERLGVDERIALDCHEGGHEIRLASGLDWLVRWLAKDRIPGPRGAR